MKPAVQPPPLGDDRLTRILSLLVCPACRARLQRQGAQALQCTSCSASYPVRDGVPILLPASMQEPGVGSADADDPVSRHPYSPKALEIIQAHADGWVLDLGAGGKLQRWDNVIQVDVFRYPMTDVVATADCLAFRDNAFGAVISQAVFEHLQYPEAAAAEIRRVLQPGGVLRIDTAFLQPEHGYPHHFYNATETGLRHWFRDFDIEWSGVDSYQHPQWSLSWFLAVYLDRLPAQQADLLRQTPLGQVLQALLRAGEGSSQEADQHILAALDALPTHELRTLAAGVSIQGRNPAKSLDTAHIGAAEQGQATAAECMRLTRQLTAQRQQQQVLQDSLQRAHELKTIAMDRANYMAQWALFHVDLGNLPSMQLMARARFALGAVARLVLPPRWWQFLRAARSERQIPLPRGQFKSGAQEPVFTVVLIPEDANSFVKSFFALAHQTYPAWELLVLEYPDQTAAVRHVLHDLVRVDERVRALAVSGDGTAANLRQAHQHARGRYVINLPCGSLPAFRMMEVFYTVLQANPGARMVVADFERSVGEGGEAMRCYGTALETVPDAGVTGVGLALHVMPERQEPCADNTAGAELVHIPQVLFRQ